MIILSGPVLVSQDLHKSLTVQAPPTPFHSVSTLLRVHTDGQLPNSHDAWRSQICTL